MSDFETRMSHVTHSAYKCNSCNLIRTVVIVPAIIEGVIQDGPLVAVDCISCASTDITTLYETRDPWEAEAYRKVIAIKTDEQGKVVDQSQVAAQIKIEREKSLLRKLDEVDDE